MTLKNDRYSYRVIWSDKDDEYLGLCAEFPSLSWLAGTPEAALKGIRRVVAVGIKIMEADGDSIPEPLSNKKYSGKFSVRIPPEVHRHLAIQAAEEGVSLNRLISARLTR
jgi:predicted HicB family RNase H-like nuclease